MDFNFFVYSAFIFFCATWLFISLVIYFIPVVIAYIRKHKNIAMITILTIFIGWTFFGWLSALLWALNSDINEED